MNGPAFFRSRRALEGLKKDRRAFTGLQTGDGEFDRLAGALLLLIDTIASRWTDAQWEAIMTYEEKGVYQKAAEVLGSPIKTWRKGAGPPAGGQCKSRSRPGCGGTGVAPSSSYYG